jgi:hypothetical protein
LQYQATVAIAVAVALLVIGAILVIIPYYDGSTGAYNPSLSFFYSEIVGFLAISLMIAGVGLGIGGGVLAILNIGKPDFYRDKAYFNRDKRYTTKNHFAGIGKIIGGVILIILGIGAYGVTAYVNSMAAQGMEQCGSFLGQLGQTFSSDISQRCSIANIVQATGSTGVIIATVFVVVGIALVILGSILRLKIETTAPR